MQFPIHVLLGLASVANAQTATYGCPPNGPLLPKPTSLADSSHIQSATRRLEEVLGKAIGAELNAGFAVVNTSFSLALVSFDDTDACPPLWEFHHRGEANTRGVEVVDGDTQYLVGSISKLYSDLLLLKTGIDLDDPITKYLSELNVPDSKIDWKNITLATLADHLAGIPPNYGFSEFYVLKDVFDLLGFPALTEADYGICGIPGLSGACSQEGQSTSWPYSNHVLTRNQIS